MSPWPDSLISDNNNNSIYNKIFMYTIYKWAKYQQYTTQDGPSPYSPLNSSPPITTLTPLSTVSTSSLFHLLLHVILKFRKLFLSSTIGRQSPSTPLRQIHGASSIHLSRLTPGTFNNNAYISIIINDPDRSPYNTLKQSEFSTLRNMFKHRSEHTNS